MPSSISIDMPGLKLSSVENKAVGAIFINNNKKIEFLPNNVYESFPQLVVLKASFCSIRSIGKQNFKNLHKLKRLNLDGNQITKILDDTFEGLEALEYIDLGE